MSLEKNNIKVKFMKIGYTGDLVLQGLEYFEYTIFDELNAYLSEEKIKLIVNLESAFIVPSDMIKIKNKVCLGAEKGNSIFLKMLNPYLINISNNHINDYGNAGINYTKRILSDIGFEFFGAGKYDKKENVHIDRSGVINISFTLRSSDQTGGILFSDANTDGPYDLDLEQVKNLAHEYPLCAIVVSIHWGNEDFPIPDPENVKIAHKIIDAGASLVIGHHPHIIQPIENYNGKWIFYSLGNFLFPPIDFEYNGKLIHKTPMPHQRQGLVPIFNFDSLNNELVLHKLLKVSTADNDKLIYSEMNVRNFIKSEFYYKLSRPLFFIKEKKRVISYYLIRIKDEAKRCILSWKK